MKPYIFLFGAARALRLLPLLGKAKDEPSGKRTRTARAGKDLEGAIGHQSVTPFTGSRHIFRYGTTNRCEPPLPSNEAEGRWGKRPAVIPIIGPPHIARLW
jgi:hypothetical protein